MNLLLRLDARQPFKLVMVNLGYLTEMKDLLFVAARRMRWDKDAWREPAFLALLIRTMEEVAANDSEDVESRAEAKMLLSKLRTAAKPPALA